MIIIKGAWETFMFYEEVKVIKRINLPFNIRLEKLEEIGYIPYWCLIKVIKIKGNKCPECNGWGLKEYEDDGFKYKEKCEKCRGLGIIKI